MYIEAENSGLTAFHDLSKVLLTNANIPLELSLKMLKMSFEQRD
jgi:hypothetical protein